MQIPLDYYRILGLPIQATAEQLRHAHRDRTLQLPRREYSEAAITARRELIDEAYAVLSDPVQRESYDTKFLARSYDRDSPVHFPPSGDVVEPMGSGERLDLAGESSGPYGLRTPELHISSIEIQDDQLVGALLILLELGEYELVLKLGRPFLSSGNVGLESGRYGDPEVIGADIVLTVALACLELGREQWQQGQYEGAAESLETGQELLLREGLFAGVRGEMQSDLFKLRPYRILELLALPDEHSAERYQGIQLLQDMLHERGGIDGAGDDQSGLSTDDFLRFVQQLRAYLTAEEQQVLFESEARRPSAVATYLAIYALMARGFAYRMPSLVRQAKLLLLRLGARQDVYLERSICALLLGQTEEASRSLEQSREYSTLSFIRDHSKDSPDLLPGLCLYAERWLQNEVFPHFRDLAQKQASLKEYFADDQVQAYLEALPNEADPQGNVVMTPHAHWQGRQRVGVGASAYSENSYYSLSGREQRHQGTAPYGQSGYGGSTATVTLEDAEAYGGDRPSNGTQTPPVAERVSRLSSDRVPGQRPRNVRRSSRRGWFGQGRRSPKGAMSTTTTDGDSLNGTGVATLPRRRSTRSSGLRLDRMIFLAAIGIIGLLVLWTVVNRLFDWLNNSFAGPYLEGEQLELALNEPVVVIPDPEVVEADIAAEAEGPLTEAIAEEVIRRWFSAKSEAMGADHDAEALETVLVGSLLNRWQGQSAQSANSDWHWEYEHPELTITAVNWEEDTPDQATVEATVQEVGEFYTDGQLNLAESYDSNLQVSYALVRQDEMWKIESIQSLN